MVIAQLEAGSISKTPGLVRGHNTPEPTNIFNMTTATARHDHPRAGTGQSPDYSRGRRCSALHIQFEKRTQPKKPVHLAEVALDDGSGVDVLKHNRGKREVEGQVGTTDKSTPLF